MKRRIFSLVVTLIVAISVVLGVSLTANAADGDGLKNSAISLAENVTLKMEVAIAAPTEGAYAEITLPNGDVDTTQLVAAAPKSGDNYVFFAEVAVKDLAKNVTIEICDAEGNTLVAEAPTSALAYCDKYLADNATGEFAGLVNALKAYANAADYYFDATQNADTAASASLSAIADAAFAGELPAGITHRSATLLLESETTIRHYFELAEGKTVEDYTFFVGNDEVTPETKTLAGGVVVYYIDIEGLTPNMLDEVYTVKVTDGTDTYTCGYSALTYAKRVYENANSDNDTKNLAAAILAYNSEAGKLKGTVTFNADGGSAVANQTYDYGVALPIVAPTAKDSSVFLGWYDEGGKLVTSIPASQTGNVSLTAKWGTPITLRDASTVTKGAKHWCYNHKDTSNPADGKCDTCGYCVDNPNCTIVNAAATAKCTTCGKAQLAVSGKLPGTTLETSKSDKGRGYAYKITDANGKDAVLLGIYSGTFYQNHFGESNETFKDYAIEAKVFALTVEVGIPTAQQYEDIEDAPTTKLEGNASFFFRPYTKNENDVVFRVKGGKAYIANDTTNAITLPEGKLTKVTVVYDFTDAVVGDGVADSYRLMLYAEDGTLVNTETVTLRNGDISGIYSQLLTQFRTDGTGRILLGDISVASANPLS